MEESRGQNAKILLNSLQDCLALKFEKVYISNCLGSHTKVVKLRSFFLQEEEYQCNHKLDWNRQFHTATTLDCDKIKDQWSLDFCLKFWSQLLICQNTAKKNQSRRIIEDTD